MSAVEYGMIIGGQCMHSSSHESVESTNPANEEVIGTFPDGDQVDVSQAVTAAREGLEEWRRVGWQRRAAFLREFARRIQEREEEFARLDTLDSGCPITAMRRDARNASEHLLYFAGLASELKGCTLETAEDELNYTLREPYGIVGRIIPFNHPFQFAAAKIAAPLAAGNVVILKPAEQTSLSALELGNLTLDLLPPGVLNIVTGQGTTAGAAVARHPQIPRVAFTGSVATGKAVLHEAADCIKTVTLELGGKNPMIVFPDVEVEAAARGAVQGMNLVGFQGQSCGANSRIFVHEQIYDRFVECLVRNVQGLRIGDPTDEDTDIGPLAFDQQYQNVLRFIQTGIDEGATLTFGGRRPKGQPVGYFIEPTIFTEVHNNMQIAQEEIFGPVVSVLSWSDLDEVIRQANDVMYGLAANIWTNNLSLAHRTARSIQAGYVWINGSGKRLLGAPFGGYKMSGFGKENSLHELLSYTQERNIFATLL
jgi:betaine-aldehyde dehydrogenase